VLGAGLAIRALFVTSPDQQATKDAPRISDTAFEAKAVAICSHYVQVFNTETTLGDTPSSAQSGAFLDSIATSFDQMVTQLETIPVQAVDQGTVAGWFAQWHQYDAFGHTYAAAVRSGTEGPLVETQKSSMDELLRKRNAFARANNMKKCSFN
jgi:hypothetical protein